MKLFNPIKLTFTHIAFASLFISNMMISHTAEAADDIVKMDRIIAIVDEKVITEQELTDRVDSVSNQLEQQGKELPPQAVLEKQILERLIVDSLQLQLAEQSGIKINDTELDKTIERIAEKNSMNIDEFKIALENDGLNYHKFRADMRGEITISRLKDREINRRVTVSDGEIDNYLTTEANSNENKSEFEISHILIRTPEDSSPEQIEEAQIKVKNLFNQLENGDSFEQVSASFSDAPNALEGGSMGWRKGNQIPTLFLERLESMQVGDVSKAIRSPSGFHILKLDDLRSGSSPLMVNQTKARHILVKLSEVVSEAEAKEKMDAIKQRLNSGAKFEEMASQFSEDGAANTGGALGWVNPGDTVPQFESAMNALALGEISEPIRSPFGWHIIEVIERREQDMTKEAARLKARQEIRKRKAEEAYQDWIGELRDRAFVELRLEDDF
jgi:peptidyl-prolyl cis-trans isomerase SurA